MKVALVGCGFVADLYLLTLARYPSLQVAGAFDRDPQRLRECAAFHGVRACTSLDELLSDPNVQIVVNLTSPASHAAVTRAALDAGKHVYSEKPLALDFAEAWTLVELAERKGLVLAGAPCTLLGDTAQVMWRAARMGAIGKVRLAYAEMEEGFVPHAPYARWRSPSGAPWPFREEFKTGCTLEHAGYALTWLCAMFGPALSATVFSADVVAELLPEQAPEIAAPDFSVACMRFSSGTVARLTCGITAPRNHALTLIGDQGVMSTRDTWIARSPVHVRRWLNVRRRSLLSPFRKRLPFLRKRGSWLPSGGAQQVDFAAGVNDLAQAIEQRRPCRLGSRFALHVTELALAIAQAREGGSYQLQSTFEPVEPMDWAKDDA
jgi:predicted dehydrogenase